MKNLLKVVPATFAGIAVMSMSLTAFADKSKQSVYMLVHNKTDQPAVIVSYSKQKGHYNTSSGDDDAYNRYVDYVKEPSKGQVLSPGGTDKWQVNAKAFSKDPAGESPPDVGYRIQYEITWPDKSKSTCYLGVHKKKAADIVPWRTECTNSGKTKLIAIPSTATGNAIHYTLTDSRQ